MSRRVSEFRESSEMKRAEPWLRSKAVSIFTALTRDGGGYDDEGADRAIERILFQLKSAYAEGYADRMKSEAAEAVSPQPKRRRKK